MWCFIVCFQWDSKSADWNLRGPENKYFCFVDDKVSVAASQLCWHTTKAARAVYENMAVP